MPARPTRIPLLPLRDVVAFPHVVMPLVVGRASSIAAVQAAWNGDRQLVLALQRSAETTDPRGDDLFRVGVVATIQQCTTMPNGTVRVLVEGSQVVRLTRVALQKGALRAVVEPRDWDVAGNDENIALLSRGVLNRFEEYVSLHRRLPAELIQLIGETDDERRMAYLIAAHLYIRAEQRQRVLEATSLRDLLETLHGALVAELELLRLERKIDDDVRGTIYQSQREYYLQEQLRAIHRELGQDDGEELDELEARLDALALPEAPRQRAHRELRKLKRMPAVSPEATVSRHYLEWLMSLPWTARTDDVVDLSRARAMLDADHYGLDDVKDRVIDYLAVLAQVGSLQGQILCLVGPPGVGKTSLGRSVANALGRPFVRMSLGGVRDEAEIRGHRRTYIGALPGRLLQAMRRAKVVNPVILLDEIDKLGHDYRGDPASALLEVLDPEQNKAFNDHFLEIDYDLSQVFFITTANSLGTIPEPLRDRMEILRLPGYLDGEKLAIARRHLLPAQCAKHGIALDSLQIDADVLPTILRQYTRESGVRELERRLARLVRKVARRRLESGNSADARDKVRGEDVRTLLGVAPYDPDEMRRDDLVGVATGLAYTSVGGDVLDVEVAVLPGRGRLHLTGTLGDVMKESAGAALTFARTNADALGLPPEFHKTRDLHVHVPAGATPKDGPSAGITIAVALISALVGKPVRADVAMTGEITLRGRVLPIGGLREKAVAAARAGKSTVVFPVGNLRDLDEMPEDVRGALRFVPAQTMQDVLEHTIAGLRFGASASRPVPHP